MKKKFLNSSLNIVKKNNSSISDEELEVITYGLEGIYLTFTKFVVLILVSLILGILKEVILLSIFYNIIIFVAFGLHASKSIHCLIMSLIMFVGGTYFCLYVPLNAFVKTCLAGVCVIILFKYAPADTEKRPIISKKRRMMFKILSTLFGLIYTLIIIWFSNSYLSMFLLVGMIEATVMIHPLSYKMLSLPYNNYKNYEIGLSN